MTTIAVVLVVGTVGSHQMIYAKGSLGSHQMVFGNKHFFMAFPVKRVDNGNNPLAKQLSNLPIITKGQYV